MRVLVTGSEGFIGKHLVPQLYPLFGRSNEPYTLDIKPGAHFEKDIRDQAAMMQVASLLSGQGVSACVHLAAIAAPRQADKDPQLAWETNVRGTHNVLMLCRAAGIRKIVFMSSAHVYGISPKYVPTDEQHPLSMLDTYTTTKILGEKLCQLYNDNYGLSTTSLRLFNAYGPGQSSDYFLGVKLAQAAAGGPMTLMNGGVTKDWVWVDDVVEAILKALSTSYVGPINIGTGKETSLAGMAEIIAATFGVKLDPDLTSTDNSPTRMCCNNDRAKEVLRWSPKVDVVDGLGRLVAAAKVARP